GALDLAAVVLERELVEQLRECGARGVVLGGEVVRPHFGCALHVLAVCDEEARSISDPAAFRARGSAMRAQHNKYGACPTRRMLRYNCGNRPSLRETCPTLPSGRSTSRATQRPCSRSSRSATACGSCTSNPP